MTQEFVTLPREVVEQALDALINEGEFRKLLKPLIEKSIDSIRAALEQPQNHVPDAGNMVPAGWKLVPVEPNCSMVLAGERSLERHDFLRLDSAYRAMLDAAPKPPTVKDSLTVEQPQADQPAMMPIAQRKLEDLMASGYTISGYSIYHEQKHQHGFVTGAGLVGWWKPEGMEYLQPLGEQEPVAFAIFTEAGNARMWSTFQPHVQKLADAEWLTVTPLYTRPQPKREPLTDEEIDKINRSTTWPVKSLASLGDRQWAELLRCAARAIEAAHNIK